MEKILNGNDLMLYVNMSAVESSNPEWKATANATSHQITLSAETKERVTKPSASGGNGDGKWSGKSVTKLSVSIKCDALVSSSTTGCSFADLLKIAKEGRAVKLKYSYLDEAAGNTYEEGLFIITSIDQTSAANEDVTYSASFENSGPVKTVTVSASGE